MKNQLGFDKDFLIEQKGEKEIEPVEGMKHHAVFPRTKEGRDDAQNDCSRRNEQEVVHE